MKRFLLNMMCFALLVAVTLAVLSQIPKKQVDHTLYASLIDKNQMLQEQPSPRIVFAGGSNLSFGLDSRRIAEHFDQSVVNMGIHAGLGIRFTLEAIKPFLKPGDSVVIVPEYAQFEKGPHARSFGKIDLLIVLFDIYPQGRQHLTPGHWLHLGRLFPKYAVQKLFDYISLRGLLNSLRRGRSAEMPFGVYDRQAFNEFGDAVAHWDKPHQFITPRHIQAQVDLDVVSYLNQFHTWARSHEISLYFAYPCFHAPSFRLSEPFIRNLHEILTADLTFPILSPPERYRFADELCFNTDYHLIKTGVDRRTQFVIEDLNPYLRPQR